MVNTTMNCGEARVVLVIRQRGKSMYACVYDKLITWVKDVICFLNQFSTDILLLHAEGVMFTSVVMRNHV